MSNLWLAFICLFKYSFVLNRLWHSSHWNFFSLWWIWTCRFRSDLYRSTLPHSWHLCVFFSHEWKSVCWFSSSFVSKPLLHCWQMNCPSSNGWPMILSFLFFRDMWRRGICNFAVCLAVCYIIEMTSSFITCKWIMQRSLWLNTRSHQIPCLVAVKRRHLES